MKQRIQSAYHSLHKPGKYIVAIINHRKYSLATILDVGNMQKSEIKCYRRCEF